MVKMGCSIPYREGETEQEVHLTEEARKLATYIVGTTGTGKTSALTSLVAQDMADPRKPAVIVLEPHGDMSDELLTLVQRKRRRDVILFSPADLKDQYDHPIGLNILEHNRSDPHEREFVSSTLISILYKLFFNSWGPRMEDLLRNGVLTVMEQEGATLLDLWLLLVRQMNLSPKNPMFTELLPMPEDPYLWAFWHQQVKGYSVSDKAEIFSSSLNKLGRFLGNPIVRNIVAQPKSGINLRQVMDEGKILFCNLAKGDLGEDNSSLLGAVIINLILIAALSRRNTPENERRPVHLYVDEYQTFATESFPILQSEARKYGITVTVAHQYRDQLDDLNKGSTMNSTNLICLRVSGRDAEELATQFDNTPPEPEVRYEPIPVEKVGHNGDVTYVDHKDNVSGVVKKHAVRQLRRPFADVVGEKANQLTTLPNRQAFVRILDGDQLVEYRLKFDRVKRDIADEERRERQAIADSIRAQSRELGRDRRLVEAEIAHRIHPEPQKPEA